MDGFVRVPISEQEPKVRATNFEEVCLGYTEEEAVKEAIEFADILIEKIRKQNKEYGKDTV